MTTNDTPGLSEAGRKAALEAFWKYQPPSGGWTPTTTDIWLRAWELATQAAYERAAELIESQKYQVLDPLQNLTPYQHCDGLKNQGIRFALLLRRLAKGTKP